FREWPFRIYISLSPEPVAALLLLAGGMMIGRKAFALCLSGAVLGLSLLVPDLTVVLGFSANPPAPLSRLGAGYWLALIGCTRGLIGAVLGWLVLSAAQRQSTQPGRLASRIRPGMVLVLCGGLAAVGGFFGNPFLQGIPKESLFDVFVQS